MTDNSRISAARADGYEARPGRAEHLAKIANAVRPREHAAAPPTRQPRALRGMPRIGPHPDSSRGL